MTARELISKLRELDPDAEIWLSHFEDGDVPVKFVGVIESDDRAPRGSIFILDVDIPSQKVLNTDLSLNSEIFD